MKKILAKYGTLLTFSLFVGGASANWGQWTNKEDIDPMTDEDSSFASVVNKEDQSIVLVACDGSEQFKIAISVGEYLGSDRRPVSYRVDKQEAVNAGSWGINTKGTMVFVPEDEKRGMLANLMNGEKIIFQVTDFRGSTPYSEFSLAGSTAAIKKLGCIAAWSKAREKGDAAKSEAQKKVSEKLRGRLGEQSGDEVKDALKGLFDK